MGKFSPTGLASGKIPNNIGPLAELRIRVLSHKKENWVALSEVSLLSSTGIWNLEDLGPSDFCFIFCSSYEHSCCKSRTMIYLITIYKVLFCIYLS